MIKVVAFIGTAGSGKTSLIRSLVNSPLDASPLFTDTYQGVAKWLPRYKAMGLSDQEAGDQWFAEGNPADDYWSVPQLIEDLKALRAGRSIRTPVPMWEGGEHEIGPASYILMEDTWASRSELKGLVDHRIQISVPFDISVARFVQRDFGQGQDLAAWAKRYLSIGYTYSRAVDKLKEDADLVLDGMKSTAELTEEVLAWLRAQPAN